MTLSLQTRSRESRAERTTPEGQQRDGGEVEIRVQTAEGQDGGGVQTHHGLVGMGESR